jgi:uncharacterized membrane protein
MRNEANSGARGWGPGARGPGDLELAGMQKRSQISGHAKRTQFRAAPNEPNLWLREGRTYDGMLQSAGDWG